MTVEPVFLLSQPRAGSTLVQRVLGSYPEVATVNEPWILLPLLSPLRDAGIHADYPHWLAHVAIRDFADALPGGMDRLRAELARTAVRLYDAAGDPRARLFLDKTPGYHLIASLLLEVFPDARFIYLWRNPLSVLASVLETWGGGRFIPHTFRIDLFNAVENLVAAYRSAPERALGVRYEDLLEGDAHWRRLTDHIGLEWDPSVLVRFAESRLHGRMGDPTGVDRYARMSTEPLEKWRITLANPVRKRWAARYLQWIGADRLNTMGYDLADLEDALHALPSRFRGSVADLASLAPSLVTEPLRARVFRDAGGGNVWRMLYSGSMAEAAARPRQRQPPVRRPGPDAVSSGKRGPDDLVSSRPIVRPHPEPSTASLEETL